MKSSFQNKLDRNLPRNARSLALLRAFVALCVLAFSGGTACASIAYGSINNFDTVNDAGVPCHGFEIELDDIHSADITYTYDYNHYGTPKITEDTVSVPGHTNVLVRYEAVWMGTGWSAYTAVPTTNIPPTQGHAFTNPSLNFGGEHFGVGYRNQPTKVQYHWLIDSGSHTLALGPQVNVSTPTFTYNPPGAGVPAQVAAVIPAPVLPLPPTIGFEFSDATWVKEILTTSHTNTPVELRDLITPDTNNPSAKDWRNGEPDQVEVQWQLLQTDYMSSDYNPTNGIGGANGKLAGPGQNLTNSDDVVTCRYEYYAYIGPYADWDTHQAMAEAVAADGIHGVGTYTNSNGDPVDLSTVAVVGKFLGAQMSAMAASAPIGLIDHLPDGEVGVAYPTRSLVIAGDTNFVATSSGALPGGMAFDPATGWVYGTPDANTAGVYIFTVSVTASNNPVLTKKYPFIVAAGAFLPPHSSVDTSSSPPNGGTTTGDGVYTNGTTAAVIATPNAGFKFVNWTENGTVVSTAASYTFTNIINQSLVANFVAAPQLSFATQPNALVLTWPTNFSGFSLQQNSDPGTTNWVSVTNTVNLSGTNKQVIISPLTGKGFFRLMHP
jgi:hypothetical protein